MSDEIEKLKMHSPDLTQDNIAKIRALFPGCVTEAAGEDGKLRLAVDFDQLRQELSDSIVEGPQERYHLNWPGKREALITANAPIAKTLRPARNESVDFDTTQNLFIEGDNLEALKLLQETYLGKVKMIYIDPPYNTGNDFVYDDEFTEEASEFFRKSSQIDEQSNRLVANPESKGRFHSAWLSMMYPRLRLARNLLSDDGVIFVSIDDGEVSGLKKMCDEVFGPQLFIGCFVWKSRQNKDNRNVTNASIDHEYILCYGQAIRGEARNTSQYSNEDNDPRGAWTSANMVGIATADRRPNLHYDLIDPATGTNYGCPQMGWRYDRKTMARLIEEERVLWPSSADGRPRRKAFLDDLTSDFTGFSSLIAPGVYTRDGTADIMDLFNLRVFDFPKPVELMRILVEQASGPGDIVVDFFAGSGATAHGVLAQNASDHGNRKFVLVQLPEVLDPENGNQKTAADFCVCHSLPQNIAELTKERIRRAGQKILEGECHPDWNKDVGFRVLKIDSSNMADVFYTPDQTAQADLLSRVDNIKPDRTAEDLLFQVLLDWGVDLTLPIRRETVQGKTVFFVDDTALMACFDDDISEQLVKELAGHAPMRIVFKDTGFADDQTKINVRQIFKAMSPDTEVKAI
ncbi:site-specific DNA-methyltransferase [Paracoccus sp. R12_1]|uniref:site-specific DNA-methyltransferase n=1 Tax=unclassified Paracoccus (in: a-proteobacteria) TaxID=2688777 RepID=UPI001ADC437D|nr:MULTISPECIES: site-specific DNA-methyltransferase [unclassified Paracoccus (in: a-proteobacteria)]MBO9455127.1 site-specific DNA-methyltransferase [Paracoccus sp. R12_2]MBO9486501.1 site-specific DNA-methyltransferase [Paracoccus sp. R12_1]